MQRFIKWFLGIMAGGWVLLSTVVTLLGWEYVYAFEFMPRFYEDEVLYVASTVVPEAQVPRPWEPEEPIRIDVHGSPGPPLRFLKRCLHLQNADFRLFTRDGSDEIELYVVSRERDGTTEVHKAVFVGILHQHERAKFVALE